MAKRLVTVGDLVVDILLDADLPVLAGQHQTARRLAFEAGGACTTILAARQLGLAVAALGTVGADMPGRFLQRILRAAAVDTSALQIPPGGTTTTVLALTDSARGEHVFLGQYGRGPEISLSEAARALLVAADAVFFPGYTLLEARLAPLVTGLFTFLEERRARVYFDVGSFLGDLGRAEIERALGLTDVLLLTEAEIPFVAAGATGLTACRRLLERYPALTIALKRGAAGCHILTRASDIACPGFPVDVLDTVGAGDAFAAAFIWADLQGYSLADCGTISNAMGAASAQRAGAGRNVPSRADVQRLLDKQVTGIQLC